MLPTIACSARGAQFRPCIDIHNGKVKQIVGSTLKDLDRTERWNASNGLVTNYISEKPASWYSELYKKDGLPGGHVIMLGPQEENRLAAFSALSAWPGGLQVGGGITLDTAQEFLKNGASHVILTSHIFRNGRLETERLQRLVQQVGKGNIVLDLSCRKRNHDYWVVTDRWQKFSNLRICEGTLLNLAESCAEFLVHGVDVEGKQCGVDVELIKLLGALSPIPVTYAGGVKDMDDLNIVDNLGRGNVDLTVGSALDIFGGSLAYAEVVKWNNRHKGSLKL